MSSSTRYNPYPTPAYLITNNIPVNGESSFGLFVSALIFNYYLRVPGLIPREAGQ